MIPRLSDGLKHEVSVSKVDPIRPNPQAYSLELKQLYLYPLDLPKRSDIYEAKEALGSWLASYSWNTFATFTFSDQPRWHSGVTLDRVERWLWGDLAGVDIFPLYALLVCEEHKSGAFHVHGLITWRNRNHRNSVLQSQWQGRYGYGRFEDARPGSSAARYLTKYITKDVSDWRLCGKWSKLETADASSNTKQQA